MFVGVGLASLQLLLMFFMLKCAQKYNGKVLAFCGVDGWILSAYCAVVRYCAMCWNVGCVGAVIWCGNSWYAGCAAGCRCFGNLSIDGGVYIMWFSTV